MQNVLDPLQQIVFDGCHLTRTTGSNIIGAGFSNVDLNMASFSSLAFINPQVYGIAYRWSQMEPHIFTLYPLSLSFSVFFFFLDKDMFYSNIIS